MNFHDFQSHQWMVNTPQIDNLSLNELTLPGTHNAGCDLEASYAQLPGSLWLACQDIPFYAQLNRGSRALDVRLLYDAQAQGLERFRFQHNGFTSSRHLGDLIRDVKAFLERSFDEFIILDFHELTNGNAQFNHAEFKQLMLEHFGQHMIPAENRHLTLGQLKKVSRLQRVLVAAPMTWETRDSRFQAQINHKWINQTLVTTHQLHGYIKEVMGTSISHLRPWSLSATCYIASGPLRILNNLDNWFDPVKSDWAKKCNIINFDFIKNSKVVFFCQQANVDIGIEMSRMPLHKQPA
jgi:hypothetical protein